MKKLLSILGAVGLVATTSASVVACGSSKLANNPNVNYKTFEKWIDETKDCKANDVIMIGGRTNVDTLSFLAARNKASGQDVDTSDVSKLTDNKNVTNNDDVFNKWLNGSDKNAQAIQAANHMSNQLGSGGTPEHPQNETEIYKNFWGITGDSTPKSIDTLNFHSILVDDISKFFNDKKGLGQQIIDGFINDQVKNINTLAYSGNDKPYIKDHIGKNQIKNEIKKTTDNIASELKKQSSPLFLVISNGKLAGVTTGYKNYEVFNKDAKGQSLSNDAVSDITELVKYMNDQIWQNILPIITNNWFPRQNGASSFIIQNAKVPTWKGMKIDDTTPYKSSTDSKDDSKDNSKSDTTAAYAIDPTKYID